MIDTDEGVLGRQTSHVPQPKRWDLSGWLGVSGASEARWRWLSYALLVVVVLLIFATFRDYGVTMDEEVQALYGDTIVAWYESFFRNRSALDFTFIYGGLFEGTAQLAARILPFETYESRHLVNALFGALSIVIAYRLGTEILSPMAGFFSSLFLTLTPVLYGHSFNNSKDIPFSTLWFASLYCMVASYKHLPRLPKGSLVKVGVCIGLATGVRVGGMMLFGYLLLLWLAWLVARFWLKQGAFEWRKTLTGLALSFVSILATSWLVMLICWPWAQVKPLISPFRALSAFALYNTRIRSQFNGRMILDADLPWNYLPTWFLVSLPEFCLISLLAGCGVACLSLVKREEIESDRLIKLGFLVVSICLPVATAIVLHTKLYDAQRHLLFAMPPIAVLAGISLASLWKARMGWPVKAAISAVIAMSAGLTVLDMIQLHPYQYVYFNRTFGGGLKGAFAKFETDYWGASYKEGAEWVVKNYHPATQEKVRVTNCSNPFFTTHYFSLTEELRERFQPVDTHDDTHIFLTTTRYGCPKKKLARGNVIHTVERQGVPLLYVIERQRPQ